MGPVVDDPNSNSAIYTLISAFVNPISSNNSLLNAILYPKYALIHKVYATSPPLGVGNVNILLVLLVF